MNEKGQNLSFLGRIETRYRTKQGWYWYHLTEPKWYRYQDKVVSVPRKSGTGTTHQNRVGIGTDPSCTNTIASYSLIFCILTFLSSNSHIEGIGTLIND